jgi:hypothetical protein
MARRSPTRESGIFFKPLIAVIYNGVLYEFENYRANLNSPSPHLFSCLGRVRAYF